MTANTVTLVQALSSSSKAQPSFAWLRFVLLCFPLALSVLLCRCCASLSFAVLCLLLCNPPSAYTLLLLCSVNAWRCSGFFLFLCKYCY